MPVEVLRSCEDPQSHDAPRDVRAAPASPAQLKIDALVDAAQKAMREVDVSRSFVRSQIFANHWKQRTLGTSLVGLNPLAAQTHKRQAGLVVVALDDILLKLDAFEGETPELRTWRKDRVKKVQLLLVAAEEKVHRADRLITLQRNLTSRKRTSPATQPGHKEAKVDLMQLEPTSQEPPTADADKTNSRTIETRETRAASTSPRLRSGSGSPRPEADEPMRETSQSPRRPQPSPRSSMLDNVLETVSTGEDNEDGSVEEEEEEEEERVQRGKDTKMKQTSSPAAMHPRVASNRMPQPEPQVALESAPELHQDDNPYRTTLWVIHRRASKAKVQLSGQNTLVISMPGVEPLKVRVDARVFSLEHATSEVKPTRFGPMLVITLPKFRQPVRPRARYPMGFF